MVPMNKWTLERSTSNASVLRGIADQIEHESMGKDDKVFISAWLRELAAAIEA